jgi:D-glycerate 3-kinase
MHYERITRHILAEMPGRADLVLELDAARGPVKLRGA